MGGESHYYVWWMDECAQNTVISFLVYFAAVTHFEKSVDAFEEKWTAKCIFGLMDKVI